MRKGENLKRTQVFLILSRVYFGSSFEQKASFHLILPNPLSC